MIADSFKKELEQHGITGWQTFPIHLIDKKGNEIPGYHGFSITGRCGPRDRSKAKFIQKRAWEGAGLVDYYRGTFLNPEEWDGSDLCIENYYWDLIASPKAAKVFKKQKAVELDPLPEVDVKASLYAFIDEGWAKHRRQVSYSGNGPEDKRAIDQQGSKN